MSRRDFGSATRIRSGQPTVLKKIVIYLQESVIHLVSIDQL